MIYSLDLTAVADEDLSRLDRAIAQRITARLIWLADNAASVRHTALTGRWRDFYRLRIGDYRALYDINQAERQITVHMIGHRSEIYRQT